MITKKYKKIRAIIITVLIIVVFSLFGSWYYFGQWFKKATLFNEKIEIGMSNQEVRNVALRIGFKDLAVLDFKGQKYLTYDELKDKPGYNLCGEKEFYSFPNYLISTEVIVIYNENCKVKVAGIDY